MERSQGVPEHTYPELSVARATLVLLLSSTTETKGITVFETFCESTLGMYRKREIRTGKEFRQPQKIV